MGVKTTITLQQLNQTFTNYNFIEITPTTKGIMDTTYIVSTSKDDYILKHYERDIKDKILKDAKLLELLKTAGLNVGILLDKKDGWYIYEKLLGDEPKSIKTFHIQTLARFLSKMHNLTYKKTLDVKFINYQEIDMMLKDLKKRDFLKYKKFLYLKNIPFRDDGIIHGDIFKDNTVFYNSKIGVFDFSDAGDGSFVFDTGVALFGFNIKNKFFINLFLKSYNQQSKHKILKKDLIKALNIASDFYGLKRVFRSYSNDF